MNIKNLNKISKESFINKPSDFIYILIGYLIIGFIGLFPLIVAVIGGYIEGLVTGKTVNEANSGIVAFGWLGLLTLPAAVVISLIWTGYSIKYSFQFLKNRKNDSK